MFDEQPIDHYTQPTYTLGHVRYEISKHRSLPVTQPRGPLVVLTCADLQERKRKGMFRSVAGREWWWGGGLYPPGHLPTQPPSKPPCHPST